MLCCIHGRLRVFNLWHSSGQEERGVLRGNEIAIIQNQFIKTTEVVLAHQHGEAYIFMRDIVELLDLL